MHNIHTYDSIAQVHPARLDPPRLPCSCGIRHPFWQLKAEAVESVLRISIPRFGESKGSVAVGPLVRLRHLSASGVTVYAVGY